MKPQAKAILRILKQRPRLGATGREMDLILSQQTGNGCIDYRKRISEIRSEGFEILDTREKHEGGTHKRYYIGGDKADRRREKQLMGAHSRERKVS
jgi:hypothetical protein